MVNRVRDKITTLSFRLTAAEDNIVPPCHWQLPAVNERRLSDQMRETQSDRRRIISFHFQNQRARTPLRALCTDRRGDGNKVKKNKKTTKHPDNYSHPTLGGAISHLVNSAPRSLANRRGEMKQLFWPRQKPFSPSRFRGFVFASGQKKN